MPLKLWVIFTGGGIVLLLGLAFLLDERRVFLPGETSDGHHLMETACDSCHVAFTSVPNANCTGCHEGELEEDTHPVKMFDDPRWAAMLEKVDALTCTSCHKEHEVAARGVTATREFCFPCHDDVVAKRASHRDLQPGSCWDSGCHNYHDNTALNVAFLQKRLGGQWLKADGALPVRIVRSATLTRAPAPDYPRSLRVSEKLLVGWQGSLHAIRDVNCRDCHRGEKKEDFVLSPEVSSCARCHGFEAKSFHRGKHGIRDSLNLSPLTPAEARRPMKLGETSGKTLSCSACHDPHSVDTRRAAVTACLGCHDDEHSKNFKASKHFSLFVADEGPRPGSKAVSCATCHLPRVKLEDKEGARVAVNHNNSRTLAPRDRMVKEVCLFCHNLEFSMNSIFDDGLVRNNFQGRPKQKHKTIQMIKATQEETVREGGAP